MNGSQRGSTLALSVLLVGFLAGVACNQASNDPATAGPATSDHQAKAKAEPPPGITEPSHDEKVQRFGMVIGLNKEKADRYNELHAHPWPEVNAIIKKCNIRNYSIYECEIGGKLYLFSYFEYVGDNFDEDMAAMAAYPKMKEWWAETDPCQIRMPGTPEGEQWLRIQEVYHLD